MKRRAFTFGLAALAAAPALPLAVPAAASAPVAAPAQFALAKLLARAHNHCSPQMLARHLKVSLDQAHDLQTLLVHKGVITAPQAGVSLATNPLNTRCITNEALKPTNLIEHMGKLRKKTDRLIRKASEPMDAIESVKNQADTTTEDLEIRQDLGQSANGNAAKDEDFLYESVNSDKKA